MILKIYNFIIKFIAIPLAGLLIVIGGLLMLVSGGNPSLVSQGRNILIYTFVALAIILGAYLMIDLLLKALGYPLPWYVI